MTSGPSSREAGPEVQCFQLAHLGELLCPRCLALLWPRAYGYHIVAATCGRNLVDGSDGGRWGLGRSIFWESSAARALSAQFLCSVSICSSFPFVLSVHFPSVTFNCSAPCFHGFSFLLRLLHFNVLFQIVFLLVM